MKKVTIRTTSTPTPTAFVPNRRADVEAICAAHPEAFPPGDANDAARLQLLTETMVPTINADHPEDGGQWGVLTKTDQNNKVPCDVMVWRPGTVTIDVMTGTGASWDVHGAANNPLWVWTACEAPVDGDSDVWDGVAFEDDKAVEFGNVCNQVYAELAAQTPPGAAIDAGMIGVHSGRTAFSYYISGMGWQACLKKHTNEFRAEYQLPPV
jgi:hypothetical protein